MFKVIAAPIIVLVLFLAYTIHSHDISTREMHEHNHDIAVYSNNKCVYCAKATEFLEKRKMYFSDIDITWNKAEHTKLEQQTGVKTVPYIFIDGKYIGGYADLVKLSENGGLN